MRLKERALHHGARMLAAEVRRLYRQGAVDYFMEPIVRVDEKGTPMGRIRDGDGVIFCCRRGEREIQLTRAFIDPEFHAFPTKTFRDLNFVTLTLYHEMFLKMPLVVAFPPSHRIKNTIGEVISRHGFRQLRVAESEKFAHITFFFNGKQNRAFPGEKDVEVPSPKDVPLDYIPELGSRGITHETIKGLQSGRYHFIAVNYANGDIIGHTDNQRAKIQSVEAVDAQLGELLEAAHRAGYLTLITADHGVIEETETPDGGPNHSHTTNPVPFFLVPESFNQTSIQLRKEGTLADIAPTILEIMGLPQPRLMTGRSLIRNFSRSNVSRPVLLVILDGWGLGRPDGTNPIFLASTPVWDHLMRHCPFSVLSASGAAVGLLDWKPGNSESGHLCIGAGRVVIQDDLRIEMAMENGTFSKNPALLKAIRHVRQKKSTLHLIALLSKKSSHGSIDYPIALLKMAMENSLRDVFVHAIFDGRGERSRSASLFLDRLEKEMTKIGVGQVVSGIGRAMALDRNSNYHLTRKAYEALVFGVGRTI